MITLRVDSHRILFQLQFVVYLERYLAFQKLDRVCRIVTRIVTSIVTQYLKKVSCTFA